MPRADFDGYLGRLSRSRRGIVRKDLRSFDGSGCVIDAGRLDVELIDTLAPLLANVQHRHGSSVRVDEVANYLRGCLSHGLRDDTVLFTCRRGADVIGFTLAYRYRSALIVRVIGLDYARIGRNAEYFTLLVHEPVRYALSHGLTTVDLGTEGYRAKLLRGANLVPLWTILLTSPATWDRTAIQAHNDRMAATLARSCGDLVPNLEPLRDLAASSTEEVRR